MSQIAKAHLDVADSSLAKLRRSAHKLFVKRGYHGTRPQDIARDAGVANGTFYLHFGDKKEAFLDFAEQSQNVLVSQYELRLAGVAGRRDR